MAYLSHFGANDEKKKTMFKNMSETFLVNIIHHRLMKKCSSIKKTNCSLMKCSPFHPPKDLFCSASMCLPVTLCPLRDRHMLSLSLKADWTLINDWPLPPPGSLTLFVSTKDLPAETSQGQSRLSASPRSSQPELQEFDRFKHVSDYRFLLRQTLLCHHDEQKQYRQNICMR